MDLCKNCVELDLFTAVINLEISLQILTVSFYSMFLQEYQEYLQMEKQLLEELGIREESDDLEEA